MSQNVVSKGDKVICRNARGYDLTEGKTYEVVQYDPPYRDGWFTWSAYTHVINDSGKKVMAHDYRFAKVESV